MILTTLSISLRTLVNHNPYYFQHPKIIMTHRMTLITPIQILLMLLIPTISLYPSQPDDQNNPRTPIDLKPPDIHNNPGNPINKHENPSNSQSLLLPTLHNNQIAMIIRMTLITPI